ncbi:MAG: hypothetical protein IJA55_02770 [Clostridia bacterium]|nr:hypothetical protein [Clostridia bacterium]
MNKDTSKIVEELKLSDDFNTFYKENFDYMATKPLSVLLDDLMKKKDLKKVQVIKNSEMAETYAYQIFSGLRVPERNKLLCIAVGMGLNIDEVQSLLKAAGYSVLYVKKPFDSIILYGICKKLSVVEINDILYDYGFETIG